MWLVDGWRPLGLFPFAHFSVPKLCTNPSQQPHRLRMRTQSAIRLVALVVRSLDDRSWVTCATIFRVILGVPIVLARRLIALRGSDWHPGAHSNESPGVQLTDAGAFVTGSD